MPASPAVIQSYVDKYSLTSLQGIRDAALEVYTNGATVSRSFEGSSLTIDLNSAERVLETIQAAIIQKRGEAQGCDAAMEDQGGAFAISRRNFRIS